MKTWICVAASILMILSFLLIWMVSPSDSTYASRFSDDDYVTVAAFDVPEEGEHVLDLIESLPFKYIVVNGDADDITIQLSTQYSEKALEYVKNNLTGTVYVVPDDGVRVNLDLKMEDPLLVYRGETFGTAQFFEQYRNLLWGGKTSEMKIIIPENYRVDMR